MHELALSEFTPECLQAAWAELNRRYFRNELPAIRILWSSRLTASMGLFYSRFGPRTRATRGANADPSRRMIRLSLPLFRRLCQYRSPAKRELISTLAHEMIHQWQYDVLKRRPNHGGDFRRMMDRMNQDGMGITVYHALDREVDTLARYVWRCQHCGCLYRRQRRSIEPRRHQCGACRGPLREITLSSAAYRPPRQGHLISPALDVAHLPVSRDSVSPSRQLSLDFLLPPIQIFAGSKRCRPM